ncbi:MAG: CHASE4 domain-containing protein [Planctomycetota bacterium]
MSIKTKVTLSLLFVVLVFCAALRGLLWNVVAPSFEELERQEAVKDLERVVRTIEDEAADLDLLVADRASSDETYAFVERRATRTSAADLRATAGDETDTVFVQICDWDGRVLLDERSPAAKFEGVELASLPNDRLPDDSPLREALLLERPVTGLLATEWGVLVVAARPVLHGDSSGPANGTLIMARALDDEHLGAYGARTLTIFDLERADADRPPPIDFVGARGRLRASEPVIDVLDVDTLTVRCTLRDIGGRAAAVVTAHVPRLVTEHGVDVIRSAWVSTLAAGLLLLAVLHVLLQRSVVGPLTRFTQRALTLGPSAEARAGLDLDRKDEFGALAKGFAALLDEIDDFQTKLADKSRLAGMSEMATNVLHNVGNMMNSVGVASSMVTERSTELPTARLSKLAKLVREKGDGLADWVRDDPAGRRLPEALSALEKLLTDSQHALQEECRDLAHRVAEVSELVRNQQSLARQGGHVEDVSLSEQVDIALRLVEPARKGVEVECRFFPIAPVRTERQKLLQVVVNLVKNAVEAFDGLERDERRIEISIDALGAFSRLTVRDNAIGIDPERLSTIFQHGFTTKSGGHGFGLHSAANSIAELGGTIRAESEGLGKGAAFVIELPFDREKWGEAQEQDAKGKRRSRKKAA